MLLGDLHQTGRGSGVVSGRQKGHRRGQCVGCSCARMCWCGAPPGGSNLWRGFRPLGLLTLTAAPIGEGKGVQGSACTMQPSLSSPINTSVARFIVVSGVPAPPLHRHQGCRPCTSGLVVEDSPWGGGGAPTGWC